MSTQLRDEATAFTVPSVSIAKLTFSGGDEVELGPAEKVMIVGANNSGKSRTIRELVRKCSEGKEYTDLVVLNSIALKKSGTQQDLESYVQRRGKKIDTSFFIGDWGLSQYAFPSWDQPYLRNGLAAGFIKNLDAASRLSISELQTNIAPNEIANKPQQLLYRDDALMKETSGLFKKAFGVELMIDFLGGTRIPIHIGTTPSGPGFEDRASSRYSIAVNSQPALHEQGDGMRSYAGIIFEAIASKRDVLCIDEPEAFLHPPQARKLGEALSMHAAGQLVVATHSSDILRGFLEGNKGKVRILRISRDKNVNKIYEAGSASIEALWKTPVLRFSNALDAIFHEQAIFCEDDSDCRLISSVAEHLQTENQDVWKDTAYVPMGGKAGIPKAAAVLRAIGVPVKAVFDFDFISDKPLLRAAVEAFGGDWIQIEKHWQRVSSAVSEGKVPTAMQIKAEIQNIIDSSEADKLPKKKDIDEAFKRKSPWARVKAFGLDGLPNGNPRQEGEELVRLLEAVGIYLIPTGEMESFCRSIGGHGPKFVTNVLTNVPLNETRLQALRDFTVKVHKGAAAPIESIGTIEQQRKRAITKPTPAAVMDGDAVQLQDDED
jgi:predicted ATPase